VYFHPKQSDTTLNLIAIERFHPMKSENILSNILSKKIYIAFEQKIAKNKMLGGHIQIIMVKISLTHADSC
jgi:hypothetical protein